MRPRIARARRPFLGDALSVLLPTENETWLLRACLLGGEAGRVAWDTWRERIGDVRAAFRDDRLGVRRLLPLLAHALRRNDAPVSAALAPYLRAAMAHEQLRGEAYSRIASQALSTLREAGIDFVALKGVAMSEAVYGTWSLRHSHDVDLLVRENDLEPAAILLRSRGFAAGTKMAKRHAEVRHASGMPVKLHAELFRLPLFPVRPAELWERSRSHGVAGVPARVLSPADALLHVCGQAACCPARESLQWAVDAWHLISRQPNLDWDMLVDVAARANLALPMWVQLDYLRVALAPPVCQDAVERLGEAARRASVASREAALFGARAGRRGTYGGLLRAAASPRERAAILKWMLFPSPQSLLLAGQVSVAPMLPFHYAYRPIRYFTRRAGLVRRTRKVWGLCHRTISPSPHRPTPAGTSRSS